MTSTDEFEPRGPRWLLLLLRHKLWTVKGWVRSAESPQALDRIYWHYTTIRAMEPILADRLLRPSTAGIRPGERPAVWFTSRRSFAPTAHKGLLEPNGRQRTLSLLEMIELLGPLFRIGVRRAALPYDWGGFRRQANVTAEWLRACELAALWMGDDPHQWRLSFDPVPFEQWVAVHYWLNNTWNDASGRDPVAAGGHDMGGTPERKS